MHRQMIALDLESHAVDARPISPTESTGSSTTTNGGAVLGNSPNVVASTQMALGAVKLKSLTGTASRASPSEKRFEYISDKHSKFLLDSLSILRRRHELCDVILVVGNRKIYAHRVLLAAYSPYFLGKKRD